VVSDTIIALGHSQSGSPVLDEGIMFVRGTGLTQAFIWDESDDTFALIGTNDDHTVIGNIGIVNYSNLRLSGLTTSQIQISNGAASGYLLVSDANGLASWTSSVSVAGTSGTSGTSATSGTCGSSGQNGTSGTSGTSATSGTSGVNGTSGTSGTSATSGTSGVNGTSGTSGTSATSGTSGSSGQNGTSGTSGTSATSGTSGANGTSGTSGTSATSGTSGTSATSGTSGTSGTRGTSGTSGTSGQQGESAGIRYNFDAISTASSDPGTGLFKFNNAAASGTTEIYIDDLDVNSVSFASYITSWDNSTSNVKGVIEIKSNSNSDTTICNFQLTALTDNLGWNILSVTYLSGSTPTDTEQCSITFYRTGDKGDGTSGTSGTTGTSGTSGTRGTSGTSGANGTSGTSGSSGANGANGTSGTSGSSGANGANGTSGTSGSSGANGANGTSGTSGSSGANGANGTSGTSGSSGTRGTSGTSGSSGANGTLSLTGATTNGVITYDGSGSNATVESNLTFDGSLLNVSGDLNVIGSYDFTHNPTTELSTSGGYGDVVTFGSGGGVTFSCYYFTSGSAWSLSDSNGVATSTGMLAIALGNTVASGMLLRGYVRNDSWTFATASAVYLNSTAGALSNTAPTAANDVIRIVGFAISRTVIFFCPDNTWIEI